MNAVKTAEILRDILNDFPPKGRRKILSAMPWNAISVAEIVVKGCYHVPGLLTTDKSDSYVTMAAVH